MSDFDRLIKNLARAGSLAARARQGDRQVIDELIDSLRAYAGESSTTYDGETAADEPGRSGEPHPHGLDETIAAYRISKDAMAAIVDKHMQAAFAEIGAYIRHHPDRRDAKDYRAPVRGWPLSEREILGERRTSRRGVSEAPAVRRGRVQSRRRARGCAAS